MFWPLKCLLETLYLRKKKRKTTQHSTGHTYEHQQLASMNYLVLCRKIVNGHALTVLSNNLKKICIKELCSNYYNF